MPLFSHMASFAFGALMGSLLLAMLTFDGISNSLQSMADSIDENTRKLAEDMVMLPVVKPERKR